MNTAVIIGICQVLGYMLIVGLQKYFIDKLRDTIKDQDNSIKALKTQAEGQAALTSQQQTLNEQMRQFMSGVLADAEKRVDIVKETGKLEANWVQQKLDKAQAELEEQKNNQLQKIQNIDEQPALAEVLTKIIEENYESKERLTSLNSRLEAFFQKTDIVFNEIILLNKVSLMNDVASPNSLTQADKDYIRSCILHQRIGKNLAEPIIINHLILGLIQNHFIPSNREVSYKDIENYANTLLPALGPYAYRA